MRTKLKNMAHAALSRNGVALTRSAFASASSRVRLAVRGDLPAADLLVLHAALRQMEQLDGEVARLEAEIVRRRKTLRGVRRLVLVHGLNLLSAISLLAEVGDIALFDTSKQLVSYEGLCAGRAPTCSVIAFSPSLSADGRFVAFGETADSDGFNEATYFGDFLTLSTTNVTTQPVVGVPSELATRAVISPDGRSAVFPTRNSLTQSSEQVNMLNLYRFTLSDADPAGINGLIQFGTPSFRVEEDAGSIAIPVIRGTFGDASGTATVDFATAAWTATAGQDYVSAAGTLTFSERWTARLI